VNKAKGCFEFRTSDIQKGRRGWRENKSTLVESHVRKLQLEVRKFRKLEKICKLYCKKGGEINSTLLK
jgi:hypothetical protein